MYPVELLGERIRVREVSADDFDAIRVYASDPEVHRHTIWQVDEPSDTVRWIDEVGRLAAADPRRVYELAIEELDGGQMVGGIRLDAGADPDRRSSIGYVLRRDRWNRGYATEAARLVIGLAFDLGAHRVFSMCDPQNTGSARVMEKAGMSYEGRMREYVTIAGTWRDVLVYAVLEHEWRAR